MTDQTPASEWVTDLVSCDFLQVREDCYDAGLQLFARIGWITGFVDGEGCFSINFIRQPDRPGRKGYTTGFQVAHEFAVAQGAKSVDCLYALKEFFGVGEVYLNKRYAPRIESLHRYVVRRRLDLINVITPFFTRYPLRTSKRDDLVKFQSCLARIERNEHLSKTGLTHIIRIAETMNHCKPRTKILKELDMAIRVLRT